MTRAPKVNTKVTLHSIDDRDLRAALFHWLVRPEEFLRRVEDARLQREWDELTVRINSLLSQMKAAEARGGSIVPFLDRIEALEKQRTANFNARWPETPMPERA